MVLHGKGTDVCEITYKPLKLNLLFRNPWGPRSPLLFPNVSQHHQTFRDYTGGGWSDIIPNAGEECRVLGAEFGLHDETPLLQWSAVAGRGRGGSGSATFEVTLSKYPFHVKKEMKLGSENEITVVETVENRSEQTLPFSWLVHPTFSWDFVGSGALLDIPAETISRMDAPAKSWSAPEFVDSDSKRRRINEVPSRDSVLDSTLVLSDLPKGSYAIRNEKLQLIFELSWDKKIFPHLWYYRSINAQNYPYFGRSRFIALEPCTSRYSGLAMQVKKSDAPTLGPGRKLTTTIVAKVKKE